MKCSGQQGAIWGMALSDDGQLIASGGRNGTIGIWDIREATEVRVLQPDRPYERMDITGLTSIGEVQRATPA